MNWRQFIRIMKIDERAALAKYKAAARSAKNPAISEVFDKLAYEEQVHIDVLERFEKEIGTILAHEKKH
jgi:rubrerythrin